MKCYPLFTFLVICVAFTQTSAQIPSTDIVIGKVYQLPSDLLEETVTLQISTPNNYDKTEDRYPVLYVLDGQWFFPHALSIRTDFTQRNGPKMAPEFIIVGITTNNSKRWEWAKENATIFLSYFENELLPFVDKNYRTSEERILFGWETTAGFVVKSLSQKPELFSAYLAASPAPLYGSYFRNLESEYLEFKTFLENTVDIDKFLFIGEGESDFPVQYGTAALTSLLADNAPKNLKWHHEIMTGLTHQMCAYKTLQAGLQEYYHYYHFLTFNNKSEFERLGGLIYMDDFYEARRIKLAIENDDKSKHATRRNLTFVAILENDYEWFDFLFTIFEKEGLMEKSFAPHLNDYAEFYLKHKNPNKASEIISFVINKYPENAQAYNILGDINLSINNPKEAKSNYNKAVEVGSKNDDWRMSEYKSDLINSTKK